MPVLMYFLQSRSAKVSIFQYKLRLFYIWMLVRCSKLKNWWSFSVCCTWLVRSLSPRTKIGPGICCVFIYFCIGTLVKKIFLFVEKREPTEPTVPTLHILYNW